MAAPSFLEEKRGGIEPRLGRNITCPFVVRKAALTCWFSAPGSAVHSLHPAFTSWAWPCVIRMLPAFLTNAGTMSGWGQDEKNSQRAYVFRIASDSCRKRAVPALTFSAKELNRSRGRFPGESSHEAHWRPA